MPLGRASRFSRVFLFFLYHGQFFFSPQIVDIEEFIKGNHIYNQPEMISLSFSNAFILMSKSDEVNPGPLKSRSLKSMCVILMDMIHHLPFHHHVSMSGSTFIHLRNELSKCIGFICSNCPLFVSVGQEKNYVRDLLDI